MEEMTGRVLILNLPFIRHFLTGALAKLLILIFSDKQGEPKPSAEGDPLFIHLFPATKPVLSLSKELGLVFRIYSKKTTY
jgi:hypothetical protein